MSDKRRHDKLRAWSRSRSRSRDRSEDDRSKKSRSDKPRDTKDVKDPGGSISELLRGDRGSKSSSDAIVVADGGRKRHGFDDGGDFEAYCRTAAAAIESAGGPKKPGLVSGALASVRPASIISVGGHGPGIGHNMGLAASAAAAVPMLPRSKKRKSTDMRVGPACQGAGEAGQLRQALMAAAGPTGEGLADPARLQEALMAFCGLYSLGETESLGDFTAACAQSGNLDALRTVLAQLGGPIAPNGQCGRHAVSFQLYQRVCDHICLSTNTEFVPMGLLALLEARFAPHSNEFANDDVLQYFIRGQHFLSLEFSEDMRALIEQGNSGVRCTNCRVTFAPQVRGMGKGAPSTEGMFEAAPQPGQRWHTKMDRFRDYMCHFNGGGEGPGRGDVIFLWGADHNNAASICIGVVQQAAGRGNGPVTVAVQQVSDLRRLLHSHTNGYTMTCVAGPSKVALDRMRSALVDLCRKTTQVPAMQWWLIHRRPTPVREWEEDEFRNLKMHLRLRPRDGESVPYDSSAAVPPLFKPGKITGQLLFSAVNPTGMKECNESEAKDKIVVFWRGNIRPEFQAMNAAAGGAVGVVLVDDDEGPDVNESQHNAMGDQTGQTFISFSSGVSPGLELGVKHGQIIVSKVEPGSKATGKVFEGDIVTEVNGSSIKHLEQWKQWLGEAQEEPPTAFFKQSPEVEQAPIPVVLARREDGHKMMLEAMAGVGRPVPPLAEIVISEYGPAGEPDMKMNKPQMEAIQAALQPIMKQKQGRVSLIQGPPGTGKTTVALQIIERWLQKPDMQVDEAKPIAEKKILVTGFSNIAIDNIAIGLQKMDLGPLLRIGRGQTILHRDTIQDKMTDHPLYPDLESMRRQKGTSLFTASAGSEIFKLERKMTRDLIQKSRVIASTCVTSGGDMLSGFNFRRILFDEATQATEPASIVPIAKGCEELVLIGDHKQLPPLIHSSATLDLGLHESLFERLRRLGVPTKLLSVQYRMHPAIAAFPSYAFYQSKLTNGLGPEARRPPLGYYWPDPSAPLCFEGIGDEDALLEERQGTSLQNRTECYRVNQIVDGLLHAGDVPASEIAVLTPYAAQAALLKSQLRPKGISAATVDSYQGRETDIVICSTVRCAPKRGVGFLSDKRRFNVLLTRARRGLIVCGHEATLRLDPCWKDWIDHVAQHRLWNGTFGDISQQVIKARMEIAKEGFTTEEADMSRVPPEKLSGPSRWMDFSDGIWPAEMPQYQGGAPPLHGGEEEVAAPNIDPLWDMEALQNDKQEGSSDELRAVIEAAALSARQKASSSWKAKAMMAAASGPGPTASSAVRVRHLLMAMEVELPSVQFSEHGPPHSRIFTATLQLPGQSENGQPLMARGTAGSKKDAERYCYDDAWKVLTGEAPPQPQQQPQKQEILALPAPEQPLALDNRPADDVPKDHTLQDLLSLGVDAQSLVQGDSDEWSAFASFPSSMSEGGAASGVGVVPPVMTNRGQGQSLGWLKQKLLRSRLFKGGQVPLEMEAQGPPHDRTFTCTLLVPLPSGPTQAMGQARTKKEAERLCCENAVNMLPW